MTTPTPFQRQRKVLHFITRIGGGGAENFLRGLAAAMRDSSWRTVIVAVKISPYEAFADELRALGCVVHDLGSEALLRPRVWSSLRRVIVQEKPDVVQTWMHHADLIGGLAAWSAGYHNVVWGVRAMEMHRNPGDSALKTGLFIKALGWTSRWLPRQIITNSMGAIPVHEAMGYPSAKFIWIPNGVNSQRFAPRPEAGRQTRAELGLPAEVPVVGFVGRFHRVKGIDLLLKTAALVQARRTDLHVVLAGGTKEDLYPAAAEAFAMLPRPGQVRFVPFATATERLYPAFTIFTLCSESEAFPNVVLEAMACGVPCATADAGDCRAMLKDLGEVVLDRDPKTMAAAWERLLSLPPSESESLVAASRERAVNEYSMARAAERFEAVYDALSP